MKRDKCSCDRAEWVHHHAFGGTYPCEGQHCIQCQDASAGYERAVNRPRNETR